MTILGIIIGVVVLLLAVGALISLAIASVRRRTRSLAAVAQQLGFSFSEADANFLGDTQLAAPLFTTGDDRMAENIMEGSVGGLRTVLFDYRFEVPNTGEAAGTVTRTQSVAAFASPSHQLPSFRLQKKRLLSLSFTRVDVEGSPEFSKRFFLTGKDAEGVRRTYSPQLVNFLVTANVNEKCFIEGAGRWLAFYQPGKRLPPNEWAGFLGQASPIAAGFFQNAVNAAPARVASSRP
jgi:hypothetical protein